MFKKIFKTLWNAKMQGMGFNLSMNLKKNYYILDIYNICYPLGIPPSDQHLPIVQHPINIKLQIPQYFSYSIMLNGKINHIHSLNNIHPKIKSTILKVYCQQYNVAQIQAQVVIIKANLNAKKIFANRVQIQGNKIFVGKMAVSELMNVNCKQYNGKSILLPNAQGHLNCQYGCVDSVSGRLEGNMVGFKIKKQYQFNL